MRFKTSYPFVLFFLMVFSTFSSIAQHDLTAERFLAKKNFLLAGDLTSPLATVNLSRTAPFYALSAYTNIEDNLTLEYRYQLDDYLSSWQSLPRFHEATSQNQAIFGLVFLPAGSSHFQIRNTSQPHNGIHIRLYAPDQTAANSDLKANINSEDCSCEQPDFCGRDCWCPAGDCPVDPTPVAITPTHLIIHHSAANTVSSDFAAVVRSIRDFHVNGNGWDDIGYNWLIDGNGVIYEGRGENRRGAHFSCMNEATEGICMIGNFENEAPFAEAIHSLEQMLAWEVCSKNIDPLGRSTHVTAEIPLDHISGHRDGNASPNGCSTTVCPGDEFYPQLPAIRQRVADNPCLQETVTSTIKLADQPQLIVFPNPSRGPFTIRLTEGFLQSLEIHDLSGRIIWARKNLWSNALHPKIDTPGVYYLSAKTSLGIPIHHRIIIR